MTATTTPKIGLQSVKIGDYIGFKMDGNERCREVLDVRPGEAKVRSLHEGGRDWWVDLSICWRE